MADFRRRVRRLARQTQQTSESRPYDGHYQVSQFMPDLEQARPSGVLDAPGGQHIGLASRSPASGGDCGASGMRVR
jgi:hypothetical protein